MNCKQCVRQAGAVFTRWGVFAQRAHAVLLLAAISTFAKPTHAAGITEMFRGFRGAGNELLQLFVLVGMVVGVGFVLWGLFQLAKKGMNRGDDIEWKNILWPIIGGALCTIVLYVVQAVVEESGATRTDIGRQR